MSYSDLVGIPYVTGRDDCYGLARKFYQAHYGLKLTNYARPFQFSKNGMDLIVENLLREGFQFIDVSLDRLELGDGIVMAITRSVLANHVGVYIGNNTILHHLYQQKSEKENFGPKWRERVLNVVRHPEVARINKKRVPPTIQLIDLMPPHVRAKYIA